MNYSIIPSVIARSQEELDTRLAKLIPFKPNLMQLDVMDGEFVPHTSLEFDVHLPRANYEAHLMVSDPHGWIMKNSKFVSSVIIHYESNAHLHDLITLLKKKKKKVGLALNPETPLEDITQYLPHLDKVLIMTVHPGKYGSPFIPSSLARIKTLRQKYPKITIEVDGGITPKTLVLCKQAGANQFVIGSYLQNAKDVKKAWNELKKALAS